MKAWRELSATVHDALNDIVTNAGAEELSSLQERGVDLEEFFGEEPDDVLLDMLDAFEKLVELRDEFGVLAEGEALREPLYPRGSN